MDRPEDLCAAAQLLVRVRAHSRRQLRLSRTGAIPAIRCSASRLFHPSSSHEDTRPHRNHVHRSASIRRGRADAKRSGYLGLLGADVHGQSACPACAVVAARHSRQVLDAQAQKDFKAIRWCNILGMPAIMASPRPLDIRQTDRMIVIAAEINAATRYIYLDRAAHISKDIFDPTTNGDSIAKWEGDTLVVDTVGFDPTKA